MINKVFQLVSPKQINVKLQSITSQKNRVLVRPAFLSICAADQRYFNGMRSKESLKKKLPMALIHEACGTVVSDPTGTFEKGTKALLVPLEPTESDADITQNYLASSLFRASGYDGFMQEYVSMDPRSVIPYTNIYDEVAAICELISVAMHSVKTFIAASHDKHNSCVVFGDGNLGYIVTLLLKTLLPEMSVSVVGISAEKLSFFSFADDVYFADSIPEDLKVDHAFECVGGDASGIAVDTIIDMINPEGTIMLMGVSENPIPINTRMVLEKGLRLIGRSRSTSEDFIAVRDLLESKPRLQDELKKIIREVRPVRTVQDMTDAFTDDLNSPFKTVVEWKV